MARTRALSPPIGRLGAISVVPSDILTRGEPIPTVCIDCRYIGARPSGIAEVVHRLVDHAPRLAPELDFLLLRSADRRENLSDAPNVTERMIGARANSPATMWLLPEIASLEAVDLFHGTYNTMPARLPMPVVTTVHDLMWLTDPQWCDPSLLGRVKERFYTHGIRRALSQSAHIAAISSATREAILAVDPSLSGRVSVTRSGVSDRFAPARRDDQLLAQFGLGEGAQYVLVVGQYAPYKNHERALEAFAASFPGGSKIRLVFVQRQGPDLAPLRRLAVRLNIAERVHFTGSIDEAALIQLYSSASALLHPSLCEGFGNPLAEAMACGCPVITSRLSAMPEVTGGAARLVDPFDPGDIASGLREVVNDTTLSDRMREAGLKRADELDWEQFALANVDIYRRVLGSA